MASKGLGFDRRQRLSRGTVWIGELVYLARPAAPSVATMENGVGHFHRGGFGHHTAVLDDWPDDSELAVFAPQCRLQRPCRCLPDLARHAAAHAPLAWLATTKMNSMKKS